MAWTAPRTWVSTEVVTASQMNTHVRDNFNETAPAKASTISGILVVNGTNSIGQRVPTTADDDANETTSSSSYTDLATTGPAVGSITTGTKALISLTCRMANNTAGEQCYMSYAVSGATTQSASDLRALEVTSSAIDETYMASTTFIEDGLTAGGNTFTGKYRVSAGTGTFRRRKVAVIPF